MDARPAMKAQFIYRHFQFEGQQGFGWLDLAQLDGTLLALDWVVGETHRIWGSAVMVAPGVALTARHVVDAMCHKGFLTEGGGYLRALGFSQDGIASWNTDGFTAGDGDLSVLTLVGATAHPAPAAEKVVAVKLATLAARQPSVGESISLVGFAASEIEFETSKNDPAGIGLFVSVGTVINVYGAGRDRSLPNPSIGVSAKTINGMSGGAAFDSQGRLIGIITSGMGENPSFISLSWPSAFAPIEIAWPPGLIKGATTLHDMAQKGFCRIEGIEALRIRIDGNGELSAGLDL
jgi:hypothetical protein